MISANNNNFEVNQFDSLTKSPKQSLENLDEKIEANVIRIENNISDLFFFLLLINSNFLNYLRSRRNLELKV